MGPRGAVRIAGQLGGPSRGNLFLLVHGLGGDAQRPYMSAAAVAILDHGHACLRMSMRGAGRSGPDFYHAGLASDLHQVLADPSLASYSRIFVIGFSLGGHVAIHLALRAQRDPRLAGIVAICSPLDLARNVELLDAPAGWIYRRHVLAGLSKIHEDVHGHAPRFGTIREWDAATIVPRFGFESVEHYWASQAAGPRLREAAVPILFVATPADPMVPAETLRPHLRRAGAGVDVRWVRRGGHVGFPANTDLGLPGELGLLAQVLTWCEAL
ncbi:alpha/beta fold hydrolase [Enhygromyxa salina]|uniref:alpha/beta fold hydrolase n=1 Tax=Enhygromyxa salina TaxID=215803 RepID=UPI0015E6053A|nr:alpha/beta fold hydrolase [Enhygromyxa salina]